MLGVSVKTIYNKLVSQNGGVNPPSAAREVHDDSADDDSRGRSGPRPDSGAPQSATL
jgi:hypothetical protein